MYERTAYRRLSTVLRSFLFRPIHSATLILLLATACAEPKPLDAALAEQLILGQIFSSEPVYAEVPRRVWWSSESPKDDFDDLALRTLRNLARHDLVTLRDETEGSRVSWTAEPTAEGARRLGTVPSARGPALRGQIAEKIVRDVINFEPHPTRQDVGRAEVLWTYENPTDLYELFETRIDKPIGEPFVSVMSISRTDRGWQVRTIVRKKRVNSLERSE